MKKGLNQTDMYAIGALIVIALFFVVPNLQQEVVGGREVRVSYSNPVDVSVTTQCQFTADAGVTVLNPPPGTQLDRSASYIQMSGGDSGRFGGSRMTVSHSQFTPNDITIGFDGTIPRGSDTCNMGFHIVFASQPPVVTTTLMLDRPPPARLDMFGILFKLIEDIGRWVKTLFGFSTYAFQKQVVVDAGTAYQKTFTFNTQGIPKSSCYDPVVYQSGTCNYLNKCYMIMPKGCADLSCAAKKDCVDITATAQPTETLAVSYTPTQLNSEYAVVAFIARSDMTYVTSSKTWSENTFIVESTKQSDVITVPGAGVPPAAKGIVELFTQFMLDLINFIKGLFGG